MRIRNWDWCALGLAVTLPTACGGTSDASETPTAESEAAFYAAEREGAVFTMSNASTGNSVLSYHRMADGSLEAQGEVATGGLGSGAGLGSQGSVTLSEDGRFLLVVNAGSNEVSSLAVHGTHLTLRSKVSSGGIMPTSVAERHHLVYALNAGTNSNIAGFWLDPFGQLIPIPGSTRALSAAMPSPAEVAIAPKGLGVVVTAPSPMASTSRRRVPSLFRKRPRAQCRPTRWQGPEALPRSRHRSGTIRRPRVGSSSRRTAASSTPPMRAVLRSPATPWLQAARCSCSMPTA